MSQTYSSDRDRARDSILAILQARLSFWNSQPCNLPHVDDATIRANVAECERAIRLVRGIEHQDHIDILMDQLTNELRDNQGKTQ